MPDASPRFRATDRLRRALELPMSCIEFEGCKPENSDAKTCGSTTWNWFGVIGHAYAGQHGHEKGLLVR